MWLCTWIQRLDYDNRSWCEDPELTCANCECQMIDNEGRQGCPVCGFFKSSSDN